MKRLLVLLMTLLLLAGCSMAKQESEPVTVDSLTIVTPKGAPVLAFYDQIANENYTRVAADAINALWSGDSSPDIMVVDLTSGINAIKNGAEYRLAAILTFGNLYVASTGNDYNQSLDPGDRLVLFGNENMLPSKVWHYLYGEEYDENIFYEADAQTAAAALASGKCSDGSDADYVLLAQPAMFAALKNNENAELYFDIQGEYKRRTNQDMIQAALFIKNTVSDTLADEFLLSREKAINEALNNPELMEKGLAVYSGDEANAQYGFNPSVVLNVFKQKNALGMNSMGLGFKRAIDIKEDIDTFLGLFNIEKTSEEIYFK